MFCYKERETIRLLKEFLDIVRDILFPPILTITFVNGDNNNNMSTVSITLVPPQSVNAVATEIYQGKPYTPVATDLTWSLQDPTIVSLVQNADGSVTLSPLTVGTTQVGCSDKTTGLSGVGTLTVTQGASGDSLTITFSSAVLPAAQIKKV
jgi:hypothetical protein